MQLTTSTVRPVDDREMDFSFTPPRPRRLRNSGLFENERSPQAGFEQKGKISEMINPDGSVTVRRKISNPDGSSSICQEEYSSLDRRILGKFDGVNYEKVPTWDEPPPLARSTSGSSSSVSTIKATPSRALYLSSDRKRFTPGTRRAMDERKTEHRSKPVPVERQQRNNIPMNESDIGWQVDGTSPMNLALKMELARSMPSGQHDLDDPDSGFQPDRGDGESSMSSIQADDFHNFSGSKEMGRPLHRVPFEKKKEKIMSLPDPSFISVSTWGVHDADVSAISGDSMGYPVLDASTAFHDNKEKSDDETEWSLLQDDLSMRNENTPGAGNGKPPLPNRRGTSKLIVSDRGQSGTESDSSPSFARVSSNHQSEGTATSTSSVLDTSKSSNGSSSQSDLVVMKQAAVLAKPKPKVRYYADPGISSSTDGDEREDLRDKGALFDAPSMIAHDEKSEVPVVRQNEEIVFTVRKTSPADKIGIFVCVREFPGGPRLVVSKVTPTGKFAESPIAEGDTVVSINGINFVDYPRSEDALGKGKKSHVERKRLWCQSNLTLLSDVVSRARDRVTFVVLKKRHPDISISMDEFSLPSLPYHHVSEMVNPDQSKKVTREVKNNDGSQTIIMEYFDSSGRKLRQTTRRRWVTFDGSTRDISIVSLTFNGELAILVKKTSQSQIVGLKLHVNRTHRGRKALSVAQVFPSGLFARTPLSVGDTILSINGVDFSEKNDFREAEILLSKAEGDVAIRALKSKEWIERRQNHLVKPRLLEESFTIPAPQSRSFEFENASYGGSTLGYRSAKKLTLENFSASERLGITIKNQPTQWGTLLVATSVAPSSRLTAAGLQVGDIILSINDVDFREEPDANKATSLILSTSGKIEIEYQHIDDPVQEKSETATIKTNRSFMPDGTRCIRTETRNPDGSILVKLEEIGPANPLDVAIEASPVSFVGPSDMSEISGWDGLTLHTSSHGQFLAPEEVSVPASAGSSLVTNPLEPVTITVTKSSESQNIGMSLVASKGVLYVKKISPGSLLVGKPVLPGDTVIAINGHGFRRNPNVREATSVIMNSPDTISFQILKTSLRGQGVGKDRGIPKKRLGRFSCNKRLKDPEELTEKDPISSQLPDARSLVL